MAHLLKIFKCQCLTLIRSTIIQKDDELNLEENQHLELTMANQKCLIKNVFFCKNLQTLLDRKSTFFNSALDPVQEWLVKAKNFRIVVYT